MHRFPFPKGKQTISLSSSPPHKSSQFPQILCQVLLSYTCQQGVGRRGHPARRRGRSSDDRLHACAKLRSGHSRERLGRQAGRSCCPNGLHKHFHEPQMVHTNSFLKYHLDIILCFPHIHTLLSFLNDI